MKRILTVFVTVALATTVVGSSLLGFEDYAYDEEQTKGPNPLVIGAEGLGALGCGTVVGYGTLVATVYGLATVIQPEDLGEVIGIILGGIAAGYGLGFPFGSAMGASSVGLITKQGGSFWWSWLGAEAGAIAAMGLAAVAGEVADGIFVGPILVLGAPTGAIVGYNLSRPKITETPGSSFRQSTGSGGSKLSFLVPEVELRRGRVGNTSREPARGSPTLIYKLTLARLGF